MKKKLLYLLLPALFSLSCPSPTKNAAPETVMARKEVRLTIRPEGAGLKVDVTPPSVLVSKQGDKLEFVVVNTLSEKLDRVEIVFTTECNPFEDEFEIVDVPPVDEGKSGEVKVKGKHKVVPLKKYPYTVNVIKAGNPPVTVDPEIEIAN